MSDMENFSHLAQDVTPKGINFTRSQVLKLAISKWSYKLRTEMVGVGGETSQMLVLNKFQKKRALECVCSEQLNELWTCSGASLASTGVLIQ